MPAGHLAIVLHAHLPYVRHPEHARPLEERWLHEALAECYLPLLGVLGRLERDGVPVAITISLTPPLAEMLRDDLLRMRFDDHLGRLERLARREVGRLERDPRFAGIARFYVEHLADVRRTWDAISGDVVAALVRHRDAGRVDLLGCSATHAYLPGLVPAGEAVRAQLRIGLRAFRHATGRDAAGIWLPECAFCPEIDQDLAAAGVKYAVLDTHALELARPRPPFGAHAPVVSPAGVVFFGRDAESSRQVWSRTGGYPGDPDYRDFYRDIGYDLPETELAGEVGPLGTRLMTGLKYHRITGRTDDKAPYEPSVAMGRASAHAAHFVEAREAQARALADAMPVPPIVVAPYDAELFGHWWFEGPAFLENVFRAIAARGDGVAPTTLGAFALAHPAMVRAMPASSSWGAGGHGAVWVGTEAAYLWRHVHHASRYAAWLLERHRHDDGLRGRALDQVIREMLLLQASDWAFIVKNGTVVPYALARVRAHVHRLRHLGWVVEKPDLDQADARFVEDVEGRDRFLAGLSGEGLRDAFDPW